jgi:hypothetical protein
MRGDCMPMGQEHPPSDQQRRTLGWTRVNEDGEVTPFLMVDCDQIAALVQQTAHPPVHRTFDYGAFWRLAARVMAHELLHSLLGTPEHQPTDCARSPLLRRDLRLAARLNPQEAAALRRIGRGWQGAALARR